MKKNQQQIKYSDSCELLDISLSKIEEEELSLSPQLSNDVKLLGDNCNNMENSNGNSKIFLKSLDNSKQ